METELREAVQAASVRPDVSRAVEGVYSTLAEAIDLRRPICKTSGRCCRFDEFGHRLYVTTMELAKFVSDLSIVHRPLGAAEEHCTAANAGLHLPILSHGDGSAAADQPACPFQTQGLCGVHAIRPFGCRIFFCDATSTVWQQELYEKLHGEFRRLHDELAVPYYYVEWRFALRSLGLKNPLTIEDRAW
jgi:Fe-S-cluster containining protein